LTLLYLRLKWLSLQTTLTDCLLSSKTQTKVFPSSSNSDSIRVQKLTIRHSAKFAT